MYLVGFVKRRTLCDLARMLCGACPMQREKNISNPVHVSKKGCSGLPSFQEPHLFFITVRAISSPFWQQIRTTKTFFCHTDNHGHFTCLLTKQVFFVRAPRWSIILSVIFPKSTQIKCGSKAVSEVNAGRSCARCLKVQGRTPSF